MKKLILIVLVLAQFFIFLPSLKAQQEPEAEVPKKEAHSASPAPNKSGHLAFQLFSQGGAMLDFESIMGPYSNVGIIYENDSITLSGKYFDGKGVRHVEGIVGINLTDGVAIRFLATKFVGDSNLGSVISPHLVLFKSVKGVTLFSFLHLDVGFVHKGEKAIVDTRAVLGGNHAIKLPKSFKLIQELQLVRYPALRDGDQINQAGFGARYSLSLSKKFKAVTFGILGAGYASTNRDSGLTAGTIIRF
jgi:hypothetical protein